jgi:predicted RNase H-like HicB family nuclease
MSLEKVHGAGENGSRVVLEESAVKYTVLLEESDEGFAVSVPGLPGCHSQGDTEAEALANITDAVREYLAVVEELAKAGGAKQATIEV